MEVNILDLGFGNVMSVSRMVSYVGHSPQIVSDIEAKFAAGPLILPGVGSFAYAVSELERTAWKARIVEEANSGRHILGICLGMQLLFDESEEGLGHGLGLIRGRVIKFRDTKAGPATVPHMGWSRVTPRCDLIDQGSRFYHVHSYHVDCEESGDIAATSNHGYEFTSAVRRGRVAGVQFHPEKSHRYGMKFFDNYLGACSE